MLEPAQIPMNQIVIALALAVPIALGACGVETAGTAATAAAIKQQEIEAGKKTMEQVQQKVGEAMQQAQQRAEKDSER